MSINLLAVLGAMLTIATPLVWAGIGEQIVEKTGILNLGIEGTMYVGAFVGFVTAHRSGSPWLGLLAAVVSGALAGVLMALFSVTLGLNQHVSGLGITLLLIAACDFTFRLLYAGERPTLEQRFTVWFPGVPVLEQHWLTYVGFLALAPLAWWTLRSTGAVLGLLVTLLAALANGLAVTVFYVGVAPLVPALRSVWFVIHIVAAAIAGAAFNIGGLAAIVYLLRMRAERQGRTSGYVATLPSSRRLDRFSYAACAFAFPLWTFAVAAGAVWAEYAWGRPWNWDPKETWALVTWIIFACYLHARATAGWKGTRAAVIAIVGLASFWFNFIGVNLLFSGLHSYAGI